MLSVPHGRAIGDASSSEEDSTSRSGGGESEDVSDGESRSRGASMVRDARGAVPAVIAGSARSGSDIGGLHGDVGKKDSGIRGKWSES